MTRNKLFLLACVLLAACKNEQAPAPVSGGLDCDAAHITTATVFATIQANCTSRGCHPGGFSPAVADFSTEAKLKAYINTNRAVFEARVTGPQADMPQSMSFPALSQGLKDSIACWIAKGLPDQ